MKKDVIGPVGSLALALACFSAAPASGAGITLSTADNPFSPGTFNQGWWNDSEPRFGENDNYVTGFVGSTSTPNTYRGFFTFDLSNVAGRVESAYLEIAVGVSASPDQVETIGLFDVSTDAETLNVATGVDLEIFNDLGSGLQYGSADISTSLDSGTILRVNLNQAAVDDINARPNDYFSIGLSLLSLGHADENELVFAFSQGLENRLVVHVVPLPASALFLMSALSALGFSRRGRALSRPPR